jgi:hypothetical protein
VISALEPQDGDDVDFVWKVRVIAVAIAARYVPREVVLVKVANWFGPKWLRFSGKMLGAVGVWRSKLTVPPFVPARVRWQRRFRRPAFKVAPSGDPLHIATRSEAGLRRYLSDVAPGAAVIWFSGDTLGNGRGAIMTYVQHADSCWAWYAGWIRKNGWQASQLKGISRMEVLSLLDREDDRRAAKQG